MTYSFLAPGTNHNTREMIKAKYPTSEIMPMVNAHSRNTPPTSREIFKLPSVISLTRLTVAIA